MWQRMCLGSIFGCLLFLGAPVACRPEHQSRASASDVPRRDKVVAHGKEGVGRQGRHLVVALHGLGDAPDSFADFAQEVTSARVVAPRAPLRYGSGFGWSRIRSRSGKSAALAKDLRKAVRRLSPWLRSHAGKQDRVHLLGYSQGGMVALTWAAMHPRRLRSVTVIGAWLPPEVPLKRASATHPLRITFLHGKRDALVAPSLAKASIKRLRAAGYRIDVRWYDAEHAPSPAMIRNLKQLLP